MLSFYMGVGGDCGDKNTIHHNKIFHIKTTLLNFSATFMVVH